MALQHAGEAVAHLGRRLADRDGAGHVGGAVEILRARIEQIKRARLEPLLGLRHAPGNGRWRRSTRRPRWSESSDRGNTRPRGGRLRAGRWRRSRKAALWAPRARARRGTGSSAAPSRRCAARVPSSSTGFLHALGKRHGSAALEDFRLPPLRAGRRPMRRRSPDRPAPARLRRRAHRAPGRALGRRHGHRVAEMAIEAGCQLAPVDEER